MTAINRRRAITGTAAVLGACGLAACADGSRSTPVTPSPAKAAGPIAATSDVPVGGCHVATEAKVVLTQPKAGDFKAFSAVCTHQGCPVSSSAEGVIPCNCHGSRFSIEDGSVVQGPATTGLAPVEISVDGESISLA